jgi:6-phosphogluconolactonase (cycloisomerase 2 family)
MISRTLLQTLGLAVLLMAIHPAAHAGRPAPGAVYTMTNATTGNEVLMYDRSTEGALTLRGAFSTGGLGTGAGLGNQAGLVLTEGSRWLIAVNAGSDEITVFGVRRNRLELASTVASGGRNPISLAVDRDLVYVLNAGGAVGDTDGIAGFRLGIDGSLMPLAGSMQPLSAASTAPAQIAFTPDGRQLVVTEKATNTIDVYAVDDAGVAGAPTQFASAGATPFGFAFGKRGRIYVSEANGGAPDASYLSVYDLTCDGMFSTLDPVVPTEETAACWVVVTDDGRFAYTTNTASGTISGFGIEPDGTVMLLASDGKSAETGPGSAPIDLALDQPSLNLYALDSANGAIRGFRVRADGSLVALPDATVEGLPTGANGLAAR